MIPGLIFVRAHPPAGRPHVFFQFTDTVILFRHERLGKLSFVQLMIHAVSGNQILMLAARVSFR